MGLLAEVIVKPHSHRIREQNILQPEADAVITLLVLRRAIPKLLEETWNKVPFRLHGLPPKANSHVQSARNYFQVVSRHHAASIQQRVPSDPWLQKYPVNATQHIAAASRNQSLILGRSLALIAPKQRSDVTRFSQLAPNALAKGLLVPIIQTDFPRWY